MISAIVIINSILVFCGIIYTLDYIRKENTRREKAETERYREFTKAIMAKDLQQYLESLPSDEPLPTEDDKDILQDLDNLDEETLIKVLTDNYANNENKN